MNVYVPIEPLTNQEKMIASICLGGFAVQDITMKDITEAYRNVQNYLGKPTTQNSEEE